MGLIATRRERAAGLANAIFRDQRDGSERRYALPCPFPFIGADPSTRWPRDAGAPDGRGLVVAGGGFARAADRVRPPLPPETSPPRIFAMGGRSARRVATAAGKGAATVAQIHARPADRG